MRRQQEYVRVPVYPETRERLRDEKGGLDTYDQLLNRVLDQYEAADSASGRDGEAGA
jgi:hypothetical protein